MVSVKYAHNLDLLLNQLLNARLQEVAGLPVATAARAGQIVRNTIDGRPYMCTGTDWELHATDSDALQGNAPAFFLARGNHTGTQLANTISNLLETITGVPLDDLAAPGGPLDLANQKIQNAAAATVNTDVPNWGQVVDLVASVGFKHVRVASTANVNAAATGAGASIDGVTLQAGDLVLLKNQTDPIQNGIYRVGAGNMVRDAASDSAAEMPAGTTVVVDQGTTQADSMWMLTTPAPFTVGVDELVFTPAFSEPNPYTAGNGISIVGNVVSAVAGTGITVTGGGININTGVVSRYWDLDVPVPGAGTAVTITHNLGRRPVPYAVMELSTGDEVKCGANYPDANNLTLDFAVAPAAAQYRVAIS